MYLSAYVQLQLDISRCLHVYSTAFTLCASLVPSPTPSFPSLLSTVLSSDRKLGVVGLGTRLPVCCLQNLLTLDVDCAYKYGINM